MRGWKWLPLVAAAAGFAAAFAASGQGLHW